MTQDAAAEEEEDPDLPDDDPDAVFRYSNRGARKDFIARLRERNAKSGQWRRQRRRFKEMRVARRAARREAKRERRRMAANDVSVQKITEWREMTDNDFNAPPPPAKSFFVVRTFEATGEALALLAMRKHDCNALLFYNAADRARRKAAADKKARKDARRRTRARRANTKATIEMLEFSNAYNLQCEENRNKRQAAKEMEEEEAAAGDTSYGVAVTDAYVRYIQDTAACMAGLH